MQGVLTENSSNVGGGNNVGYIDTGNWMSYPVVTIPSTGVNMEYRVASLQLEKAGDSPIYGSISIPATGGWQTWVTVSHLINLSAGPISFDMKARGGGWNINWFCITRT